MPVHDWARVYAGLFHDFHQSWSIRIKDAMNAGLLRLPRFKGATHPDDHDNWSRYRQVALPGARS